MDEEELKSRLLSRYDIEEFCDVAGIELKEIIDMFLDRVYNKLSDLEVQDPEMDHEEAQPDSQGFEITQVP